MHPPSRVPGPIHVDVDLQLRGETGTSTIDTPLPPIFYVIVGAGPAAVINHATLVRSDYGIERLNYSVAGKIPILHIGFKNPWDRYMRHGMGQPPYLLSLPGFKGANQVPPSAGLIDGGLDSRIFAKGVNDQFDYLREREVDRWRGEPTQRFSRLDWPWIQGWVAHVQTRAKEPFLKNLDAEEGGAAVGEAVNAAAAFDYPNFPKNAMAPYRLIVVRKEEDAWKAVLVYAQFIDVCTGTGRPRVNITPDTTAERKKANTPPWLNPATWNAVLGERRILTAMDAICDDVVWKAGERICVPKGGGIALNAAEKSVHNKCYLDWFNDKTLDDTFVNTRNYTFIKHWSEDRAREVGENKPGQTKITGDQVVPAYGKGRLGEGAGLKQVKLALGGAKVEVELEEQGKAVIRASNRRSAGLTGGMWDSTGGDELPASKHYDRIALAQGLDPKETGQPFAFAATVAKTVEVKGGDGDRMLVLGSADQTFRILGAAAQVYPGFGVGEYKPQVDSVSPMAKMWAFRATLPLSTVPDGFILSSINIAAANKFFSSRSPNPNVNTMETSELTEALRKAGIIGEDRECLLRLIVTERNPANGYKDGADLVAKLKKRVDDDLRVATAKDEDTYAVEKRNAAEPVFKQELDGTYQELDQTYRDAVGTPAESQISGQVTELKKYALLKYNDQVRNAEESARNEYRERQRSLSSDAAAIGTNEQRLLTAFRYSYDPVDD